MALEQSDLAQLGAFFRQAAEEVKADILQIVEQRIGEVEASVPAPAPETPREAVVGKPDVDPEAGPEFYIHLADGQVIISRDSASTHMAGPDGQPVQVIGRYQKGQ